MIVRLLMCCKCEVRPSSHVGRAAHSRHRRAGRQRVTRVGRAAIPFPAENRRERGLVVNIASSPAGALLGVRLRAVPEQLALQGHAGRACGVRGSAVLNNIT